jgi:hypothetical protein
VQYRPHAVFACLILAQAAHSVEEYFARLYDVFAPARFISSLVSDDIAFGFLVANVGIFVLGVWCWAVPVRSRWPAGRAVIWFWAILEVANGINHSAIAASRGSYFPGVITAPLLILFGGWLLVLQTRHRSPSA